MSQLILMIAKMEELDNPEKLTDLWRQTMPTPNLSDVTPSHYLNELENQVIETGWEAVRHLLVEQWRLTDGLLVEKFRQKHAGAARRTRPASGGVASFGSPSPAGRGSRHDR